MTKENHKHWRIRLLNPEKDFAALLALRRELEALEPTDGDTSEAGLRATFKWRNHDPAQDRWVATAPDEPDNFIAYAWVYAQSHERVVTLVRVHPAWRRQGLGSDLLAHTLERARQYGATHVTGACWQTAPEAHQFLTHHDFAPVGHNRFFHAPPDVPLPDPVWPDGYTVRNFAEVQDLALLVKVCNRAYHDMWGHAENVPGAVDEERLAEGMRNSPAHYNPESMFIAFAPDGDVAGICFGRIYGDENNDPTTGRPKQVVDSPGVVPEHRHMELQRPLTLTAMHWLRATAGVGPIQLHTYGDQEIAVAIYHALGFVLDPNSHLIEYRLALPAHSVTARP
ncbi:MAG: GNAT family N-acetyltransferase [Caldilineaceae bacterium]